MKRLKIGVLVCIVALAFCMPAFAMDYTEPFKNAATVVAQGPNVTGMEYGLTKVTTTDGKCYLYLTDRGQYVKFKACGDEEWTAICPDIPTIDDE